MKKLISVLAAIFCGFIIIAIPGCAPDRDEAASDGTVTVRLVNEPDRLHPVLSTVGQATDIESYLFWPLAGHDPYTLERTPLLVDSLPEPGRVSVGPFAGDLVYTFTIRPEARWSDGTPIRGEDYAFTVKSALNPYNPSSAWRSYLSSIKEIDLDPVDPKTFSVIIEDEYFLAGEVCMSFGLIPAHHMDPSGRLTGYSVQQLKNIDVETQPDTVLEHFMTLFTDARFSRDDIITSGPYRVEDWQTQQRIDLIRTPDWWGSSIEAASSFWNPTAERIEYIIIGDETVALAALEGGTIDIISSVSPDAFNELRERSEDGLEYYTPVLSQYYYLGMNGVDPILRDLSVRRALAHTMDVVSLRDEAMQGYGTRIIGPIPPGKSYYNTKLTPLDFNLEKAATILSDAGWIDQDGNGILDKNIDGKLTPLSLRIQVTSRPLGQTIARLLKADAQKIGIEINIVVQEFSLILKDLRARSYQLTPLLGRTSEIDPDLFQSWHRDNSVQGSNYSGFGTAESDALIEEIRSTLDPTDRSDKYRKFQQLIYEQQPVIFLLSPQERIIHRAATPGRESITRPGFSFYGND